MRIHKAIYLAALLGWTGHASATITLDYYTIIQTDNTFTENASSSTASAITSNLESNLGDRSASAQAYASAGVLRASSTAAGYGLHGAGSESLAAWSTTVTFNNADLTGQSGTVTLYVRHSYVIETLNAPADQYNGGKTVKAGYFNNLSAVSDAGYFVSEYATDVIDHSPVTPVTTTTRQTVTDVTGVHEVEPTGSHALTIRFTWGNPVYIQNLVDVGCGIGWTLAEGPATCVVNATHSSYWAGISDVYDVTGSAIGNYTIDSDFAITTSLVPVPEPACAGMLLAGIAVLAALRRKIGVLASHPA